MEDRAEPTITQATVCDVICPSELDGKTLLMRASHALVTGQRKFKLELDWKFSPCWPALRIPEGAMQAAEAELSH